MKLKTLEPRSDAAAAARLSAAAHGRLRERLAFLPARCADDFVGRIQWVMERGVFVGVFDGGELTAFLGGLRDVESGGVRLLDEMVPAGHLEPGAAIVMPLPEL